MIICRKVAKVVTVTVEAQGETGNEAIVLCVVCIIHNSV